MRGAIVFLFLGGGWAIGAAETSQEPWRQALVKEAFEMLDRISEKGSPLPEPAPRGPLGGKDYDKLYISVLLDGKTRCCQSGSADRDAPDRLGADIREAVDKCLKDDRFGASLTSAELGSAQLLFSFLKEGTRISAEGELVPEDFTPLRKEVPAQVSLQGRADRKQIKEAVQNQSSVIRTAQAVGREKKLEPEIERGIHGLKVESGDKRAFYIPSVAIKKNYTVKKTLRQLCQKAGLPEACYLDPETEVIRYETDNFLADRRGKITELYRHQPLLAVEAIDPPLIRRSIRLAGDWFLRQMNPETGLLEYMYLPSKNAYSGKNNQVRQTAALWAMAALGDFLGDPRLKEHSAAGLRHYLSFMKEEQQTSFIELEGESSLAYSAFAVLALIHQPDYPDREELLRRLAEGILGQQQEDGSLRTYFLSDKNTGTDYYPGEAMLALMRLYQETKDTRYRDAVQRAFSYYRDYWRGNKNTAFVPWQTQAYFLLYRDQPDPELAAFIYEMNDWLIDTHQPLESPYKDLLGGFKKNPSNSTASYAEGINDAYALAVLRGDKEKAEKYRASLRGALRFALATQYTEENAFYLDEPEKAIGGFRQSLVNNEQRIDYTQHCVFALLKALDNKIFG